MSALNAGAVVVAALYFGRELLVPLVLAVLLAFVLAPVVVLLQRARLPKAPAVFVAVALAFTIIGGIGAVVGGQATTLAGSLPSYQATIQEKMRFLATGTELLDRLNNSLQSLLSGEGGDRREARPGASRGGGGAGPACRVGPATSAHRRRWWSSAPSPSRCSARLPPWASSSSS